MEPPDVMLRLFSYNLPLLTPFKTAAGTFNTREGLLIHAKSGNRSCWAETSPLPGFSVESLQHVIDEAPRLLSQCITENRNCITNLPSLAFAADCILWYLNQGASRTVLPEFKPVSRSIPVNASLGNANQAKTLEKVDQFYKQGYKTFKFKVGIDAETEGSILASVRRIYPEVTIRIDANCAWSFQSAVDHLSAWQKIDLEYCEEPVTGSDPEMLAEIRKITGVPLAADESVRTFADAATLISGQAVDFLILKPSLIGSITDFLKIRDHSAKNKTGIIVTTALESGIGRNWIYSLASVVNPLAAMGLATGFLFGADVADDSGLFRDGKLFFEKNRLTEMQPDMDRIKLIAEL